MSSQRHLDKLNGNLNVVVDLNLSPIGNKNPNLYRVPIQSSSEMGYDQSSFVVLLLRTHDHRRYSWRACDQMICSQRGLKINGGACGGIKRSSRWGTRSMEKLTEGNRGACGVWRLIELLVETRSACCRRSCFVRDKISTPQVSQRTLNR